MHYPATLLPASCAVVPKFRGKWVSPPALDFAADLIGEYRFMMLTALPGSGKTRLMTRMFSELQANAYVCCWLRIPPQMQPPGAISRIIATSLVRGVIGDRSATAALLMGQGIDPGMILSVALNEVAAFDGAVVLFIDDIHHIDAHAPLQELQGLIDLAPENLRIVMASRTMTRLKLAKARNDGLLVDLKHQDFEVSFKQLPEIIADAGLPITEMAELRELWHRTRGWVAGLRLLARNKVRTPAKATNSPGFAKSRELLDYFEQEVFAGLSDAARGALDVMLTPRRLVHDLMLTLGGDEEAAAYLDELEAQGLLTRLPHQAVRTYRAAPLLVEATRAHSLLASEEVAALHRRCCDWFEAQGQLTVAAAHAVDGGDIQRAILLIERCGIAMIADGDITELQSWLPSLPLADLRRHPIALLAVAWALSLLYRLDEAAEMLSLLEQDLVATPALAAQLDANISALRIMHLSMRDDFQNVSVHARIWRQKYAGANDWFENVVDNSISFSLALTGQADRARMVLERAYLPDFCANSPYAAIYSRSILGLIDLRDGQVRRAEANFSWAVKKAETDISPNSTGGVMAAGLLASACYERNDIARVQELIASYAWSLHAHLFTDARFHAYRAKARDLSHRGQYRAAITSLERILDAGPAVRLMRVHVDVLAEKIIVALDNRDTRMATAYIRALDDQMQTIGPDAGPRAYAEAVLLGSQAHLDIVLGMPENAMALLAKAIRIDIGSGWRLRAFHWAVLMVRALWRQNKRKPAMRLLDRLLGYAARAGIFRTILDGGSDIAEVLNAIAQEGRGRTDRRKARLLQMLREAFDPRLARPREEANAGATEAQNVLTEREIALIRFARAGLTNRQIAERMHVSENTIKWHLKNVFEKAGIKRRAELAGIQLR